MKAPGLTQELYQYILQANPVENVWMEELRLKTDRLKYARLRSPTEQIHFMMFLLKLIKPETILEVGTFTGYSTLAMALATPDETSIITCDLNHIFPETGQDVWERANVKQRIKLLLGPAINSLSGLQQDNCRFDFIFIDADKENYIQYFEQALSMLTPKGVIMIDNVLWKGEVINEQTSDPRARAMQEFNQYIKNKVGIDYCLIPIGDGVTLVSKGA